MTNAADAVSALLALGLTPRSEGGQLFLSPDTALTPEALALARQHKALLVEALDGDKGPALLESLRMESELDEFFACHSPGPLCPPVHLATFSRLDGRLVPTLETRRLFPPNAGTAGSAPAAEATAGPSP